LFQVDESKDTTTRCQLIERVEIAANIATWAYKRNVQELTSLVLTGKYGYLPDKHGKLEQCQRQFHSVI
jgi:hypothetical protein